jgi:hypothetical protein
MDVVDELFAEANAVGTGDVSRAFDLSEAEARTWADELGVAKIGASYAWTRPDVEALAEQIDAQEEPKDDEDDAEDDDDEGDEDE